MSSTWIERLQRSDSLPTLLDELLRGGLEITTATRGNIQKWNQEAGTLDIVAHSGFRPDFLKHFESVKSNDGSACALALRASRVVTVEDVASDLRFSEENRAVILAAGVRSVQSTPIVSSGGTFIGVLSTHFSYLHRPARGVMDELKSAAAVAADIALRQQTHAGTLKVVEQTQQTVAGAREMLSRLRKEGQGPD